MAHVSWNINGFSKLSALFIPNFAGHRFAQEGRWTPAQFESYPELIRSEITNRAMGSGKWTLAELMALATLASHLEPMLLDYYQQNIFGGPNTGGIKYFQTGLRFTTTVGPVDFGVQYFYGNLFRPDFSVTGIDAFLDNLKNNLASPADIDPSTLSPQLKYNRYHQIGLDYAQVLVGFNVRAEFAVHLTDDLKGTDGSVRNPFIGWSFGFDRDLFWGINANIQCNETVRLFNSKVGNNPVLDCEADTKLTSTRITMRLSKKFLKDELESTVTVIYGVEDMDCYIIPSLVWTIGNFSTELSAGIFTGKESGELGQYWENSFIRLGVKYTF
jgi:hypothetical protein